MEQQNKTALWMVSGGLLFVVIVSGATYFLKELSPTTSPRASTTASPGGGTQPQVIATEFPIWKTITLGTYKDDAALRDALVRDGVYIPVPDDLHGKSNFTVANTETTLDLVNVSVADLGFTRDTTRRAIYERAQELGLALVPLEVGPQLRLQYKDQPMDGFLAVGSEEDPRTFLVEKTFDGDSLWLYGDGDPDGFWGVNARWVFARPK